MRTKTRFAALFLALSLLASLTAPALAAETASVIRLTKTTGTVEISKSSGKSISLLKNMRLYNGYHVSTGEESYAWINLDDSKLLKEDAASEVEVRKDGKKLEVQVVSGNVFFDVAEDLKDDESLNIRTSTTVVGIRGTSGWLEVVDRWTTRISVLEGEVECSVADPVTGQIKSEEVRGGETALCVVYPQERTGDKSEILREKYTVEEISGFVLTELVKNIPLCDIIEEETGLDIPRDLATVAGGDPSGRTPDRENATPEVLGEADRREDEDEDALHKKLEELEKEQEKQGNTVSGDKAVPKPAPGAPSNSDSSDDDSGSGSGENSGGTTTPEPPVPQSKGMKLKDVEVQALLNAGSSVSITPNTDASDTTPKKNILEVDTGLTVASGKTLTFQPGIDMEVYPGKTLRVDGTLTADNLQNDGIVAVTSGDTLRLRGNLTTSGTLSVTATGRVIVDGIFTRSGTLSLTSGAAVLAKTFAPNAAPSGWEISATADENGYYTLIPSAPVTPPEPAGYAVTFDADGGTLAGPAAMRTDETGNLPSWPADPTYGDLTYIPKIWWESLGGDEIPRDGNNELQFLGWFDAPSGGTQYTAGSTFTADTTLYARWADGWFIDSAAKTLVVVGGEAEKTYDVAQFAPAGGNSGYFHFSSAPWGYEMMKGTSYDGCGIETVEIKGNVTSIGDYAFFGSYNTSTTPLDPTSLTSVKIPDSVTSIGLEAFGFNPNLKNITLPSNLTSIGNYAFYRCTSLTSVTIPDGVTSIGAEAFMGCSGLTSVTIPSSVTSMEESAFEGCTSLTSVEIPASVTSIAGYVFSGCSGLTSVTIPASVTSIGKSAFYNCSSLTSVFIPAQVTTIGLSAFDSCTSLTSVTIPASVTSIGEKAFYNCTSLTAIDFRGTTDEWRMIAKEAGTIPSGVIIECTDGNITTP